MAIEYRASELGSCIRRLVAKASGYTPVESEPNEGLMRIFKEGDSHEILVVEALKEMGYTVSNQQDEIWLTDFIPGVTLTGHIDGIVSGNNINELFNHHSAVLEIKTMGDDQFKAFKKNGWNTPGLVQKYKWQISVYMMYFERPALFVFKNRNNGELLYMPVQWPFHTRDEIIDRLVSIQMMAQRGELPACDIVTYPCPFAFLHEEPEVNFGDESLSEMVIEYKELKSMEEEITARVKELRRVIEEKTGGQNTSTMYGSVSFYTKKYKKVDLEAIYAQYGINPEDYTKTTESDPIMTIRLNKLGKTTIERGGEGEE